MLAEVLIVNVRIYIPGATPIILLGYTHPSPYSSSFHSVHYKAMYGMNFEFFLLNHKYSLCLHSFPMPVLKIYSN